MKNNNSITIEDILSSSNPLEEIKKLNAQIYPAKCRVETNDKASDSIFYLTPEQHAKMQEGAYRGIIEKRNHKVNKKKSIDQIISPFRIYTGNDAINTEPIDEYDRDVLSAFIANWLEGNYYLTPGIIHRFITGKVNVQGCRATPTAAQYEKIMKSVRKLMTTLFDTDMTEVCHNLKYNDGKPLRIVSTLLPACYIEGTINGQDATLIFLDREPPTLTVAKLKKQILTYDAALLDVPNSNNTPLNIAIKNYELRRIMEIIQHHMTPTLRFDDVFKKLHINDKSRKVKMDARQTIIDLLNHLKNLGVIDSFELVKKGNTFVKIIFSYSNKKTTDTKSLAQNTINTDSTQKSSGNNSESNTSTQPSEDDNTPTNPSAESDYIAAEAGEMANEKTAEKMAS